MYPGTDIIITARCTIVHSERGLAIACRPSVRLSVCLSVRPSVCDVGGSGPHRLGSQCILPTQNFWIWDIGLYMYLHAVDAVILNRLSV